MIRMYYVGIIDCVLWVTLLDMLSASEEKLYTSFFWAIMAQSESTGTGTSSCAVITLILDIVEEKRKLPCFLMTMTGNLLPRLGD